MAEQQQQQHPYQPGLEVSPYQYSTSPAFDPNSVQHQNSGLEVVPEQYNGLYPVEPKSEKTIVGNNVYQSYQPVPATDGGAGGAGGKGYDGYGQDMSALPIPVEPQQHPEEKKRKMMWWILGAALAVIVIVAAVVGGVVGSRASHSNSNKDSSSSNGGSGSDSGGSSGNGTSSSNSTGPLENIRPNSKLAVTGYLIDDGYRIRLFFQGPDGDLRYSDFLSVNDAWSNPIVLDNLNALNDTPVAASTWLDEDPPQMYLFYLNEDSNIKGQLFQDGTRSVKGDGAGINTFPLEIPVSSHMSAYFPYVVSQDTDGTIRWIQWNAINDWSNKTFDGVTGSSSTGLAMIPAAVDYLDGGAFIYRTSEGKMETYLGSQDGDVPGTWAWAYGDALSQSIPESSAIGAFVYGRSADLINTMALYQDNSGTLQLIWQNDTSSGWQGPKTWDALSGADNGTDIACVTQTAWDEKSVNISTSTDMSRCYFQSGGKVKEVRWNGSKWLDLGFLPIT